MNSEKNEAIQIDNEEYEKFAKWQNITREQLSSTSNLLLGLATGILAFTLDRAFKFEYVNCAFKAMLLLGCFLLLLSIISALICAINRLRDFRLTAKIANPKYKNHAEINSWRANSRQLGERTWFVFYIQIIFFALGSFFCVTVISIKFI